MLGTLLPSAIAQQGEGRTGNRALTFASMVSIGRQWMRTGAEADGSRAPSREFVGGDYRGSAGSSATKQWPRLRKLHKLAAMRYTGECCPTTRYV
jgi:hypothetical protein